MISQNTTLEELAAIISAALESNGIVATLSGGAAVTIYTDNQNVSKDLDFVTVALVDDLANALEPLGFRRSAQPRLSVFEHPDTEWYIEFPPAPLSFGGTYVDSAKCALISTAMGNITIITPTHSIMDRLIAAVAWNEQQSLELALLVAEHQGPKIDWNYFDDWVKSEGIGSNKETAEFYETVGRQLPN